MRFPIAGLLDDQESQTWIEEQFHPEGLKCPECGSEDARYFRTTETSRLAVYRCRRCDKTYNLYSGTVFEKKHLRPAQVVMLLRGICKGEPSAELADELCLSRSTVHELRKQLQENAEGLQPKTSLPDEHTESDEMFQNAGEKGERHLDPADPPRRRANKRRGHGSYDNDRPPIVGTVGRESGEVRLRVVKHADKANLLPHVHGCTDEGARVYTDEWRSYEQVERLHHTVNHGSREWARDDDGDGVREVHINTIEGLWTTLRNFLRPFRGVHKKYLAGYVAMCEFAINLKRITPAFIASLVAVHSD
jgi:transposase-like protein